MGLRWDSVGADRRGACLAGLGGKASGVGVVINLCPRARTCCMMALFAHVAFDAGPRQPTAA